DGCTMRTLSSTLIAAVQAGARTPVIDLRVNDRLGGVRRLGWRRLYGGAEPDYFHALAVAGDGGLVRARLTSAGDLYVQRVAAPGPGAGFGSWTLLETGQATAAGVALAANGGSAYLLYVGADGRTVRLRRSSDYGASFAAAVTVVVETAAVTHLA